MDQLECSSHSSSGRITVPDSRQHREGRRVPSIAPPPLVVAAERRRLRLQQRLAASVPAGSGSGSGGAPNPLPVVCTSVPMLAPLPAYLQVLNPRPDRQQPQIPWRSTGERSDGSNRGLNGERQRYRETDRMVDW